MDNDLKWLIAKKFSEKNFCSLGLQVLSFSIAIGLIGGLLYG